MNNNEKRQFYMDHIYSHRKDVYRILWSMFGDPDIVEEIAQGVLEHAWRGLDTLKDQNKSWAWLKGSFEMNPVHILEKRRISSYGDLGTCLRIYRGG